MTLTDFVRDPVKAFPASIAESRFKAGLLLVVVSLAMFLPGFAALPPMDRDEPRFAQASKQMLETGDFVAIRFQDEARNKKPVGIYWLQSAVVDVAEHLGVPNARTTIALYRLPSLLGAIAAVLLTYWCALPLVRPQTALLAALFMATCLLLGVEARLAKTDAVVTATVVAAMGVLARVWMARGAPAGQHRDWFGAAIFWTAIGVGILVKGPITPMVPAFAALVLVAKQRSGSWLLRLEPLLGLAWCLLFVAPWFTLIMQATHGAFLSDSVGGDMLGKVAGGQEAHGAPPGTYLVAFLVTGWPFAPLAVLAVPFSWMARREASVAFLLAWIVPAWLLFEAVPTKLPHYVLPLYPAIAILTALALERGAVVLSSLRHRVVAFLVPAVAALFILCAIVLAFRFSIVPDIFVFVIIFLIVWQMVAFVRALSRGDLGAVLPAGAGLALLSTLLVYNGVLTTRLFQPFAVSPRLAEARAQAQASAPACPRVAAATTGYREPSLIFLAGTDLLLTTGAGAASFLDEAPCRLAFVESRDETAFRSGLADAHRSPLVTRVKGVNLNGGRSLDIGVYLRGAL